MKQGRLQTRTIKLIHPRELTEHDIIAWRAIQAAAPELQSPLLSPDFTQTVGAVRADARVAIALDEAGGPLAFLAFHRRPGGFGRPIGAPFCDYHALICQSDAPINITDVAEAAGLSALHLTGLINPGRAKLAGVAAHQPAYRVRIEGASADYLAQLKNGTGNRYKNFRRYSGKLERAFGPLDLRAPDWDASAFDRLLGWKSLQLHRSGLADFLAPPWCRTLMETLFTMRGALFEIGAAGFQGLMISLYAGDRHVAGHFGVRLNGHFHPWISAMDPDLDSLGAGFVHQWKAIEAMSSLGLHTYDLGPGEDHWKRLFTSNTVEVCSGLLTTGHVGGKLDAALRSVWGRAPISRAPLVQRLSNRLDHIATLELTLGGRALSVANALFSLPRRNASRRSIPASAPKP